MEATEKDPILHHWRKTSIEQGGIFGTKLKINRSLLTIVGGLCVVAVFCVVSLTSSSSGGVGILRQSAPNQTDGVGQDETAQEASSTTLGPSPSTSTTSRGGIFDIFRRRRNSAPSVRTSLGRLKGVNLTSRAGREYFGFYNVPYAEPPVGDLRFMPPQPAKSWSGTRDATVKGSMCTQKSRYNPDVDVEGGEDCLHCNIFTPKIPRIFQRVRYPVIVYFFGGGFMHGTANDFNTDYFMDEDVVLVIVESRVGALGFLNTGDLTVTGNMGLKDQIQAMRWVKDNIADFGGDPEKVVAFGSSSGAGCSHAHLISPMADGLMSGVISFSGGMLMPETFDHNPTETARKFGEAMNCTELDDSELLVSCLRNVSAHDIALFQPTFGPSVEAIPEDGNLTDIYFPDTPFNLIMQGKGNKVPWLVGVNSAEAILNSYTFLLDPKAVEDMNNHFDEFFAKVLSFEGWKDEEELQDILHTIREFYFGNETISKDSMTRYNLTDLISDRMWYHPTRFSGLQHAENNNSVYWYYLTKEANVSFADSVLPYFDPPYGVSHADEVQYVFSRPRYPYIPMDSEWYEFSKMFVHFLVSFAANGAPENPDTNGTVWPAVDPADNGRIWYNLDDTPELIEPFTDRMELWDSFPLQLLYNSTSSVEPEDEGEYNVAEVAGEDDVLVDEQVQQ